MAVLFSKPLTSYNLLFISSVISQALHGLLAVGCPQFSQLFNFIFSCLILNVFSKELNIFLLVPFSFSSILFNNNFTSLLSDVTEYGHSSLWIGILFTTHHIPTSFSFLLKEGENRKSNLILCQIISHLEKAITDG